MDVLSQKTVTTRKDHHCFGCARKVFKGSEMQLITTVDGGDIASNYWCKTCQEYWSRYMEYGDMIGYGELKSEDEERWLSVRNEMEYDLV
ncbi:hypothetical protein [Gracilibacillus thailandensis]|uniref:Uncharacterized protein n=1 Tax=Gracilibacillus thailandensis TaxID=563735 RepID=A0A6N7QZ04_9BACI|nr:hypothetical protein [Gracilibacillus thailandensis]MRI65139.1 hypothetical protein [Gracilibacillus thailandensis]